MEQPTKEQIKEFWEWCGIKPELNLGELIDSEVEVYQLPRIDLNNLFKYAVPKLPDVHINLLVIKFIPTINKKWACRIEHLGNTLVSKIDDYDYYGSPGSLVKWGAKKKEWELE